MQPIIFSLFTCLFAIWRKPVPLISLNLAALAIILGIFPLLFLAELPQQKVIQYLVTIAFCLLFFPYKMIRLISLGLWAFIFGCWHGHHILA